MEEKKMKRLLSRFRGKSGASLAIVLIFLSFCLLIGSSVLLSASSNVGDSRKAAEEEQVYLTAKSAGQLLKDQIAKLTLTMEQTPDGKMQVTSGSDDFSLSKFAVAAVSKVADGAGEQPYPATVTGVSGMDAQMELTMTNSYDLTAVIRAQEGKNSYQLTAYFIAVTKPAGDGTKTEISWQFDRFAAGK